MLEWMVTWKEGTVGLQVSLHVGVGIGLDAQERTQAALGRRPVLWH